MKYSKIISFILGTTGYTLLATVDYKIALGVLLIMIANLLLEV